jgi:hypothetical protein
MPVFMAAIIDCDKCDKESCTVRMHSFNGPLGLSFEIKKTSLPSGWSKELAPVFPPGQSDKFFCPACTVREQEDLELSSA